MTKAQKELMIGFVLNKDNIFYERTGSVETEHIRKNIPFKATLTYKDFYLYYNLCNIEWYDEERNSIYKTNMKLLDKYIKENKFIDNKITNVFIFQKRGDSIFLTNYE